MDEPEPKDEDLEPMEDLDDPLLPISKKKKGDDELDIDEDESLDELADLEDADEEEVDQW